MAHKPSKLWEHVQQQTNSQNLFVYGTLLSGFPHDRHFGSDESNTSHTARARTLLAEMASLIGESTVCGLLFDLGGYPGLVLPSQAGSNPGPWHEPPLVIGELYRVRDLTLFHHLDLYEEAGAAFPDPQEYLRLLLHTQLKRGGATQLAWTYVYNWRLRAEFRLIKNGDYLSHLRIR